MAPFAGRISARPSSRSAVASYELPLNMAPHAIHGVVFDRPWTSSRPTRSRCGWGSRGRLAGTVTQRFVLDAGSALGSSLELAADEPMPAWMGWHPWFRRRIDGARPLELGFEPGAM